MLSFKKHKINVKIILKIVLYWQLLPEYNLKLFIKKNKHSFKKINIHFH